MKVSCSYFKVFSWQENSRMSRLKLPTNVSAESDAFGYMNLCISEYKLIISDAGGSSLIDARWGHLHTIWIEEPLLGDTKSSSALPIIAISSS